MDIYNEYIANEKNLSFYAGKAILNKVHAFYDINGDAWNFSQAIGFTFKIWEEREGGILMINWGSPTNIPSTTTNNEFTLNAPSSDTDIERGTYYYEIEYLTAGGYSVLIGFGKAYFI